MADNSKTLRELIEAGPSGSSALPERSPIGVPEGYSASQQRPMFNVGKFAKIATRNTMPQKTVQVPPRYYEGDELLPASLSSEDRARIQRDLADAGLLTGKFRLGYWDVASQRAYAAALGYANQTGKSVKQAIAELKTHPEAGTSEDREPLVIKKTDPESLRGVFRDVSRKLLGRQLSPDELEQFIGAYNQVEAQKQTEAYNVGDPEGQGGTISTIPNPDVYVEERLRKERPTDVAATAVNERADEFFGLLGAYNSAGE